MKLRVNKSSLQDNPARILRRFGYGFIRDRQSGQDSFVKRLGGNLYPRFHIYIKEEGSQVVFDLHLDQQPSTSFSRSRHKSEYGGELVEKEMADLEKFIHNSSSDQKDSGAEEAPRVEKKGWLSRFWS